LVGDLTNQSTYVIVPQLLKASVYSLPGALFFYLAEVNASTYWTAATITDLQTVQVLPPQMTPDNFFAHSIGNAIGLINRIFVSPFLGQFIHFFISQYPIMARYPQYSDFY
jgi:hypothetical protein